MNSQSLVRHDKIVRYKAPSPDEINAPGAVDPISDYMNVLSIAFSMFGLMMKIKWCSWMAIFCSSITFSNSKNNEDTRQIFSSFMLSVSAVVMTYLQNPQPMTVPWLMT
ncbi:protein Asterix [Galendromus occidentalis]|uniref:Protein Asterix n=1 Tax=Galendromus occidentalis TaxID=34638 RepID=A0AAJ6VWI4_9ACAR|nr:protein Asterix [Galendromus occidentalis]